MSVELEGSTKTSGTALDVDLDRLILGVGRLKIGLPVHVVMALSFGETKASDSDGINQIATWRRWMSFMTLFQMRDQLENSTRFCERKR